MEQKSNKTMWVIIAVIVVALLGVAAYAIAMNRTQTTDTTTPTEQTTPNAPNQEKSDKQSETGTNSTDNKSNAVTITFTDQGFTPASYTVKSGNEVTVKNNSSMQLQFSSDDHPTHTKEPELNLSVIDPGKEASFTPTKLGSWGFHNHLDPQFTGRLTVTK